MGGPLLDCIGPHSDGMIAIADVRRLVRRSCQEGGKHVREGGIVFDSEPICIPVLKSFLFFSFFGGKGERKRGRGQCFCQVT